MSGAEQILILGTEVDPHARAVATVLRDAGRTVLFFDSGVLPSRGHLVYEAGPGGRSCRLLATDTTTIDLDRVAAIWFRRPSPMGADAPAHAAALVKAETVPFVHGLLAVADCRWMPAHPQSLRAAESKIEQLARAERLGFEIPPTLVTNDPARALDFYRAHDGDIVSKVASQAVLAQSYPGLGRFTERVTRLDLVHIDRLQGCPTTFQARVPKRLEVRATVVGDDVFAAEIHSQSSRQSALDWRRHTPTRTPIRRHQLPPEVSRRCLALVGGLGLTYGAIDLIVRPDGGYVFLEVNPNGQYLWIEDATGLPISAAIATFLAGRRDRAAEPLRATT
jgi:glutathione synthase/RimK-type ligase-like ATP-grasp enzyme